MSEIFKIYTNLREKDKKLIGTYPIDNRIILSKLITNTNADSELKYVWINRAVAQVSNNNTSAILGLDNLDPRKQKISRRITLKLRKMQNLNIPFEINNSNDFDIFIEKIKEKFIIIKQNYPNYSNEENSELKNYNFRNKQIIYANSEEGNRIIGENECLEKLCRKDKKWLKDNIEKYLTYFYKKNNLEQPKDLFTQDIDTMSKLVKALLIPCVLYKGDIKGLRLKIKELLNKDFLPVLKFSDSISGYGVHYPKDTDGKYDIREIEDAIKSDTKIEEYLVSALNKNGQKINYNYIVNTIKNDGIILQKYIKGNDYAIGFFKPLEVYNKEFSLNMIDLDVSDVLTEGTAHYGDVLHYEEKYINKILKNTVFKGQEELIFLAIEILIYLLCLNEKLVNNPEEFEKFNFEDFGIQLMIDNITGEMGLIEINGRTPSHNFNHFNLLSMYGKNFQKKGILPKERVFCTSTKFIKIEDFYELIQDVNDEEKLIKYLVETIRKHYVEKCKLLFFGVSDNYFSLYYAYFLDENDIPQKINENITDFLKKIIEVYK